MAEGRKSVDSVSHGRGGFGNISADDTPYVDGEIVREGVVGDHRDGAYSTGRGGASNIGSPGWKATERRDKEAVPEAAMRPSQDDQDFHVGRGGDGNVYLAEQKTTPHPQGLADKLKKKLFGSRAKVQRTTATTT